MTLVYYDNYPAAFYRIPKYVYKINETVGISNDAIVLYGIILDRASLSRKNGWLDNEGKTYVYLSHDDAADIMRTTAEKTKEYFGELEESGLIEIKTREDRASLIYPKVALGGY